MRFAFLRHDQTLVGTLIKWWTKAQYSHCEILFGDELMFSAHPKDGTGYRTLGFKDQCNWDYLDLPTSLIEDDRIKCFCEAELGCSYDWKGIWLSQIIRMSRASKGQWFCSEFCTAAAQQVGRLQTCRACDVSPGHLYKRLKESGATPCDP